MKIGKVFIIILLCLCLAGCFAYKKGNYLYAPLGGEWKDGDKHMKVKAPLSGVFEFFKINLGGTNE